MDFEIETEQEADGRWIAEVVEIPGALVYGVTRAEAVQKVQALAIRAMADKLDHAETSELNRVTFQAA